MMSWKILEYQKRDGSIPFREWFLEFRDIHARTRIRRRLDRLKVGNFGDSRNVGKGLFELRFHFGPGYRVYYGIYQGCVVILLSGGDKSNQEEDIRIANVYWQDYLESQI